MTNRKAIRRARRIRRTVLTVCLMALVAVVSIGATIAWLTDDTDPIVNTFTVGEISIKLDEQVLNGTGRTEVGQDGYKIYPGAVINKDPQVTVNEGSEDCYVYVSVVNNIKVNDTTVATLNIPTSWKAVGTTGNETVYAYVNTGSTPAVVSALNDEQVLPEVFTTVTISGTDVTETNITSLEDKTIVVEAYAHQSNATTAEAATTAALAHFEVSAN